MENAFIFPYSICANNKGILYTKDTSFFTFTIFLFLNELLNFLIHFFINTKLLNDGKDWTKEKSG